MKRTLSLIMTVLVVFSAFALWTLPASAAAEIVQDDLVSWYDGDDYEGTTWTDKKGDNDITDCVDGTFKDGAYVLDKAQQALPNALYDVIRGDEFTVEMNLGAFSNYPDTGYTTWLCNNSGTTAEKVSFYIELRKGTMDTFKAKTSGIASASRPAFTEATETLQNATLAITFKAGGKTNVYVNGVLTASADSPAANANADVGSNPKFILGNAGTNNCSNTAFEGLRFYSRALTADEVKNNADVDNAPAAPEGPAVIKIASWWNIGWENWKNSPNNPNGAGAEPGVTQMLVEIADADGAAIDIDPATTTWKVTISANGESKTIEMDPATRDVGNKLYRFETCMGEGENQFVPVKDTDYTVQITVYGEDGAELYKSEATSGFVCKMDPVVPEEEPVDPPVEPPVEPPVTGDATAIIAVLALVALFGAAIVTKKAFVK